MTADMRSLGILVIAAVFLSGALAALTIIDLAGCR